MKRIIIISESINPPYDEGIKKTVFNIIQSMSTRCILKVISRNLGKNHTMDFDYYIYNGNRLFLSTKLFKEITSFNASLIIYFPFQSATFATFLRAKILALRFFRHKHILFALQPKHLSWKKKFLIRIFLKPKILYTPSPSLALAMSQLKIKISLFPLMTDMVDFYPNTDSFVKENLRLKFGIPLDKIIVLHIGHLTIMRNLESLLPLQSDRVQVVIVDSSSTPKDVKKDSSLKEKLVTNGIIIIDRYVPVIREIYQFADIYIFPVTHNNSSIGLPLSVLEARACGLPVITTDFEGIKEFLKNDNGAIVYSTPDKFIISLNQVISTLNTKNYFNTSISELNAAYFKLIDQIIS